VIAVVDYGASNLRSVLRAFRAAAAGASVEATSDPDTVRRAERVVVPGVGHFAPARERLAATGLDRAITDAAGAGRPVLGICLGLQLLLEGSDEAPGVPGLGLLPGRVREFATGLPVPHVGWARVRLTASGRAHGVLAPAVAGGEAFYYHVHSFHPDAVAPPAALAEAEYGATFATIVGRDRVLGVQFHPEKSQTAGLALLGAFAAWRP
jgi:glutamine amidotransferase